MYVPTQELLGPLKLETTLKYLMDFEEKPVFHASAGGIGHNQYDGHFESRPVTVRNGRENLGRFDLDEEGFLLTSHETQVTNFYDETQIKSVYETEIQRLIRELTGAARVRVFDHTFRSDSRDKREEKQVRDPVPIVHNDYTDRSARQRVRDLLPPDEVNDLLANRFAIINIWRSVGGRVETTPLAMCDARSVSMNSLISMERRAKDRIGEMQQVTFDPEHRWYFFPNMDRNEALVFKTYDSATDGRARLSLHSAFENPAASPTAQPRESIETRVFAFFQGQ